MLAELWRRSGGVHVAEEVLDPPKGDAAARVTHLQRGTNAGGLLSQRHSVLRSTLLSTCWVDNLTTD